MHISARNQLRGQVTKVTLGAVMAEVHLQVGSNEIVSVITRGSAEAMNVKVGDELIAVVKATEVMLGKP